MSKNKIQKWVVELREVYIQPVLIKAKSKKEAINSVLEGEGIELDINFSHSLDELGETYEANSSDYPYAEIVIPKTEIKVNGYIDFCSKFNIKKTKIPGDDGTDEELIINTIKKIKTKHKERWIINFIENSKGGYFLLQKL